MCAKKYAFSPDFAVAPGEGFLDPFCTVANDRTPDGLSAAQRRTKLEESKQTQGVSIN